MAGLLETLMQQGFAAPPDMGGFALDDAAKAKKVEEEYLRRLQRGSTAEALVAPNAKAAADLPFTPEPAFGAGAQPSPYGMLGSLDAAGQIGAQPAKPDLPPPTNDPAASEPVVFEGGVPLPRPRPEAANNPGAPLSLAPDDSKLRDAATLALGNAQRPAAAPAAAEAPESGGIGGMFKKLLDPANAPLLLSLAGGFSGAPSLGTGMRRAFSNAAAPAESLNKQRITQTSQKATVDALVAKGVPYKDAVAAALNPKIMDATAAKYYETKPFVPHKIGTDMMGNDIMGSFNPNNNKYYDAAGREIGGEGSAGGVGDAGAGMLAKGVKEYNQELPADEYKAQFSPAVQAQIEAYVNGDTMPTGNPRLKGSATKIKEWATLWGNKAGVPVNDAAFSGKRTMLNQVASSAPNSMGGILSNGKSAFQHLANLGDTFVELGNRSGPSLPGGSWVGRAANVVGNEILPTPETSGNLAAVRDNAGKYGTEATKFYAGTGGGVEERLSALKEVAAPGTLATEQAAYLKTEKNLMLGRLAEKESQLRDAMGEAWLAKHPVRTPQLQKDLERIDKNIARLESGAGKADDAAPAASVLPVGESTTINGVTIKRVK